MHDIILDEKLLPAVVAAAQVARRTLAERFSASSRPTGISNLLAAIAANDDAITGGLRTSLLAALPGSRWIDDEDDSSALTSGEWWVADPVEGNINHIHGRSGWGVTAALVRDGVVMLCAIVLPQTRETYSAMRGQGAFVNGARLYVSSKTELAASIVGTGQAKPREPSETYAHVCASVRAMLTDALLVRMSVPATLELVEVAAGRMDAFWQYRGVRSGLAAGALLVEEAGGVVTTPQGEPWTLKSMDFLAAAPGIHSAAVASLTNAYSSLVEGSAR